MTRVEPFYRELGRRVRLYRTLSRMSQEDLGLKLRPRVTRACISGIEKAEQRVLAHTVPQLAKALDVSVSALMGRL